MRRRRGGTENPWSDRSIKGVLLLKRRESMLEPKVVEKIMESRDPVLLLFAPKFCLSDLFELRIVIK